MRTPAAGLILVLIFAAGLRAAEPTPAAQLAAIKAEMDGTYKDGMAALEKLKGDDESHQAYRKLQERCVPFLRRAVALAEKYPDNPAAPDALAWIMTGPFGYRDGTIAPIERTYELLRERYAGSDAIPPRCVSMISRYAPNSVAPEPLLRAILAKNPSRELRGIACYQLAELTYRLASFARRLQDPAQAKEYEAFLPAAAQAQLKAMDPAAAERESEQLLNRTVNEFGSVKSAYSDATLGEIASGRLFYRRNLVVGKPIPDIECAGIDGKPLKLSAYRGKVVALVFWASWCGPCMAIVPHERELVKRLEDKPFALVGVNGDETRDAAKTATDKEKMTWPSFFDGKNGRGPVAVKWGVSSWPTIFVIDAHGIIRHADHLTMAELDKAIDAQLAEMDGARK